MCLLDSDSNWSSSLTGCNCIEKSQKYKCLNKMNLSQDQYEYFYEIYL